MTQPATGGISVAGILQSIQESIAGIAQDNAGIQGNSEAINKVLAGQQELLKSSVADAATIKNAETAAVMGAQSKVASFMQATDFEDVQAQVAAQLSQRWEEMQQLDASITAKESVSFLDNPIMWVGAQLSAQPDIARYNALVDSYNALEKHKTTLDTLVVSTNKAALASMETVTADSAAASARLAGLEYNLKADNAAILALQNDTQTLDLLRKNDLRGIELANQSKQAEYAAQDQARQIEEFSLRKQQFQLSMQRERRMAEKENRVQDVETAMLRRANLGAAHLKSRQFTSVEEFEAWAKLPANTEAAQNLLYTGWNLEDTAVSGRKGVVKIGDTPADAAEMLVRTRGTLSQSPTVDKLLKEAYRTAMSGTATIPIKGERGNKVDTPVDPKKPGAVKQYINYKLNTKAVTDAEDVTAGGTDNIYYPPTVAEMITTLGGEDKLPVLYQKLLKAELKPTDRITPDYLFSRAVSAVTNKTIKLDEAIDSVALLANASVSVNNAVRNYTAAGVPAQERFSGTVKIHPISYWGDKKINLDKRAEVANALALAVATKKAQIQLPMDFTIAPTPRAALIAQELRDAAVNMPRSKATSSVLDSYKEILANGNAFDFDTIGMTRQQLERQVKSIENELAAKNARKLEGER